MHNSATSSSGPPCTQTSAILVYHEFDQLWYLLVDYDDHLRRNQQRLFEAVTSIFKISGSFVDFSRFQDHLHLHQELRRHRPGRHTPLYLHYSLPQHVLQQRLEYPLIQLHQHPAIPHRVWLVHGIQRLATVCPQFDNLHASSPPPQYILMIIMSPSSQNAPFFSEKSSHV